MLSHPENNIKKVPKIINCGKLNEKEEENEEKAECFRQDMITKIKQEAIKEIECVQVLHLYFPMTFEKIEIFSLLAKHK